MSGAIGGLPPDLENFIAGLPPDVQDWIRLIITGGITLTLTELRKLLVTLLLNAANWETMAGILAWLARLGLIDGETVIQAITGSAEIAVEAEGAAVAAPAAVAGISAAALAAILTMILAVIGSGVAIGYELTRGLKLPPNGKPCGLTTPGGREMATLLRTVEVDAWGARRSLNQAMEEAQRVCNLHSAKCAGNCPGGGKCAPMLSVESVEQTSFIAFTRTQLTFACPCGCT